MNQHSNTTFLFSTYIKRQIPTFLLQNISNTNYQNALVYPHNIKYVYYFICNYVKYTQYLKIFQRKNIAQVIPIFLCDIIWRVQMCLLHCLKLLEMLVKIISTCLITLSHNFMHIICNVCL